MTKDQVKRRPCGLKRTGNEATPAKIARIETEEEGKQNNEGPEIHTENIAVPVEVQGGEEAEDASDVFTLYASGLTESAKGSDDVAKKFFEGVVHELQNELDKENVVMPVDRRHLLGNAWVQVGGILGDWEHLESGIEHLKIAVQAKSDDKNLLLDLGLATLSRYRMQAQSKTIENEEGVVEREVKEEETVAVKEALVFIDKALALGDSTDKEESVSVLCSVATAIHQYAQTLPADLMRVMARAAADKFMDARKLQETVEICLSIGQTLIEASETLRETPELHPDVATGLLNEAKEALETILKIANEEETEIKTEAYKM
eukprot:Ihof_evm2s221 gene=Ihof_evmTU2s221